ncbi:sigma-70 family RNA polymerase sigma factor [Hymenobacter sp. BT664]|uniref:Sigma-70 family RNA polymerase sigma factor n=1 Tax=Hymenobacter montanus TaxID=2771359 RepID=A0A927BAY6_9BACT|nr:sigma-70 family RNA polymerase sigma factor [Hymenobacter montanus]MBD2767392.1 sigma-70 family RNA polymerase sigma factor [Hymenobacter montanus]
MKNSLPPSDQQTLAGLRSREDSSFAVLYTFYYPAVERFVLRNSGSRAEAQDIFQETILVLLEKVPTADFQLTSSLKTYLLSISRNLWLKRLRQAGRVVRAELEELEGHSPATEPAAFGEEAAAQQQTQVRGLLARISAKCQALIQALFFNQKTIQAVAQDHHYTSVHNAQNQKYKCLEQARRGVRNNSA